MEVELGMYLYRKHAMTVPGRRTESAVHIPVQLLPDRRHAAQIKEGTFYKVRIPDYLSTGIFVLSTSVPDPWHFGVDPDPRIHASD